MSKCVVRCVLCVITVVSASVVTAQDWPQFRGPSGYSYADVATALPLEDGLDVAWEVPTNGQGISGAIVIGGQVVVSSSGGEDERDLSIESFDVATGDRLWWRTFHALGRPYTHPTSANAAPTPASDGEHVVAFFSSCDLVCLKIDGTPVWYRALAVDHPQTGNDISMTSSPAIFDGVVALLMENQGDSFAAGIDLATGVTLWEHARPRRSGWSSPIGFRMPDGDVADAGEPVFAFQNGSGIELLHARSGDLLRSIDVPGSSQSSPVWVEPLLIATGDGLTAVDLSDADSPVVWENTKLTASSASPVVTADRVYTCRGSILIAADRATGEMIWRQRMNDVGTVWATPVATRTGIYVVDQSGAVTVVVDEGGEARVVGRSELTGPTLASPAVSAGAVFIRSDRSLIKIASQPTS
ncbi:MAG: PQQ-binding-like beta-propeller repeat protein [Planctomycetota bacterium]